jgi:hypothetical protein
VIRTHRTRLTRLTPLGEQQPRPQPEFVDGGVPASGMPAERG